MFGNEAVGPLVILALPFVAGLVCWFMFVAARQAPSRVQGHLCKISPRTANSSGDTLGVLAIADAYDPNRSVIWENQVCPLQRIGSEIKVQELAVLWEQYLRLYPELYEKTIFSDLLAFLQNCNLAESDGTVVRLTSNGWDFLNLLVRNVDARVNAQTPPHFTT